MTPKLRFPDFIGDWKTITFGELVEDGVILKPMDGNHGEIHPTSKDYVEEGVPFLMASDISNGQINFNDCKKISESTAKGLRKGFAQNNDVLLTHKGTVGETAVLETDLDFVMLTPQVTYYRVKDKSMLESYFLHSAFQAPRFQKNLNIISGGGTRAYIGITKQLLLKMSIPAVSEQKRIASIFLQLDQKINLLTKKKEALETYKKGLMQKIFSQELSFKREDGTDYPEWRPTPLKAILKERKTLSSDTDSIELVSLTKEGVVAKSDRYNRGFLVKDASKKYKMTQLNDICYNPANLKFGVICRNTFGKALFSPIYVTFEVNNHLAENSFIELFVTTQNFIQKALKYQEGTVYERMAVKPNDLVRSVIQLPCIDEQKRIVSLIEALDAKVEKIRSTIESTKLLKKGLLQQMFV